MPAIGIDLGTNYCCVGILREEISYGDKVEFIPSILGKDTTPSIVGFGNDGEPLVANAAKSHYGLEPENYIFDVKRLIGRKFSDPIVQKDIKCWQFNVVDDGMDNPLIKVMGKNLRPEQICARILSHLKFLAEKHLGGEVTDAVITVPAYFNDRQRQATRDAGTIAGLNVLQIINEPTAAAITYNFVRQPRDSKTILVFDLGGGTLDISILRMKDQDIEVLGVGGDMHLGGQDFDDILFEHCLKEFKNSSGTDWKSLRDSGTAEEKVGANWAMRVLKNECERKKIHLSMCNTVFISLYSLMGPDLSVLVTRQTFEDLNKEMFDKCVQIMKQTLEDVQLNKNQIDEVILAGGASLTPAIVSRIENFFHGKKELKIFRHRQSVAYGAALLASSITEQNQPKIGTLRPLQFNITDVYPFAVGMEVDINVKQGVTKDFSCVTEKNTQLPFKKIFYFIPQANQSSLQIRIFRGEHDSVAENDRLGEFDITGLPTPSPVGEPFEVTVEMNAEGILSVTATCCGRSKESTKLSVKEEKWRLTANEILDMKKQEIYYQTLMMK